MVDGNRELGHIGALYAVNLAIDLAKKNGVGIVALKNVSRYSRITPYGRKIGQEGLIGIITNNGGPGCVAPFGGKQGLFEQILCALLFLQKENSPMSLILLLLRRFGER